MNAHAQLHQYFRDSYRNGTGSIKEAYELSLAAEKHYAQQEAEIVNLKEKIASQANMIDKLQLKAGHVDLLRDALGFCIPHAEWALQGQMFSKGMASAREALEQTKDI